eukprot:scpid44956/ scgid1067/ 
MSVLMYTYQILTQCAADFRKMIFLPLMLASTGKCIRAPVSTSDQYAFHGDCESAKLAEQFTEQSPRTVVHDTIIFVATYRSNGSRYTFDGEAGGFGSKYPGCGRSIERACSTIEQAINEARNTGSESVALKLIAHPSSGCRIDPYEDAGTPNFQIGSLPNLTLLTDTSFGCPKSVVDLNGRSTLLYLETPDSGRYSVRCVDIIFQSKMRLGVRSKLIEVLCGDPFVDVMFQNCEFTVEGMSLLHVVDKVSVEVDHAEITLTVAQCHFHVKGTIPDLVTSTKAPALGTQSIQVLILNSIFQGQNELLLGVSAIDLYFMHIDAIVMIHNTSFISFNVSEAVISIQCLDPNTTVVVHDTLFKDNQYSNAALLISDCSKVCIDGAIFADNKAAQCNAPALRITAKSLVWMNVHTAVVRSQFTLNEGLHRGCKSALDLDIRGRLPSTPIQSSIRSVEFVHSPGSQEILRELGANGISHVQQHIYTENMQDWRHPSCSKQNLHRRFAHSCMPGNLPLDTAAS